MKYEIEIDDRAAIVVVKQYDENGEEIAISNILPPSKNPYGCTCGSKDDHHTVNCYLGLD